MYTFVRVEADISRAMDAQQLGQLKSSANLFLTLVDQAIDLGLPERIAKRRSTKWLVSFIGARLQ